MLKEVNKNVFFMYICIQNCDDLKQNNPFWTHKLKQHYIAPNKCWPKKFKWN